MSSITPHNDNFLPENISIYNNNNNDDDDDVNCDDDNDDANKSNNSDDDDDNDEFDDFISSQWKDSVEIGLIINYPLPCTNYLSDTFELNNSHKNNEMSDTTTENENDTNNNNNSNNNDNHARLPSLILSTRLEERSIAPIFDGTQWAGTRELCLFCFVLFCFVLLT